MEKTNIGRGISIGIVSPIQNEPHILSLLEDLKYTLFRVEFLDDRILSKEIDAYKIDWLICDSSHLGVWGTIANINHVILKDIVFNNDLSRITLLRIVTGSYANNHKLYGKQMSYDKISSPMVDYMVSVLKKHNCSLESLIIILNMIKVNSVSQKTRIKITKLIEKEKQNDR
jgi:uncharacterized protein YejL (UPF0352 family)